MCCLVCLACNHLIYNVQDVLFPIAWYTASALNRDQLFFRILTTQTLKLIYSTSSHTKRICSIGHKSKYAQNCSIWALVERPYIPACENPISDPTVTCHHQKVQNWRTLVELWRVITKLMHYFLWFHDCVKTRQKSLDMSLSWRQVKLHQGNQFFTLCKVLS